MQGGPAKFMTNDVLNYADMIDNALKGVLRESLMIAAERGLPGAHHFYITFRTDRGDVHIPDRVRAQYPQEMTIVLQHQFWGLEVNPVGFSVTLSFGGQQERLEIPFAAVTAFADPSTKFGLQFKGGAAPEAGDAATVASLPTAAKPSDGASATKSDNGAKSADVVTLDAFRKK